MSTLREELERIRLANRGVLVEEDIIKAAAPRNAPLHHRFEWDNKVAGHKYRLIQAAELIREVTFTSVDSKGEPQTLRYYTSRHRSGGQAPGYLPTEEVLMDDTARTILLQNMVREIAHLRATYGHLEEFAQELLKAAAS